MCLGCVHARVRAHGCRPCKSYLKSLIFYASAGIELTRMHCMAVACYLQKHVGGHLRHLLLAQVFGPRFLQLGFLLGYPCEELLVDGRRINYTALYTSCGVRKYAAIQVARLIRALRRNPIRSGRLHRTLLSRDAPPPPQFLRS